MLTALRLKRSFSTGSYLCSKKLEDMFNAAYKTYKAKKTGGSFFEPTEKILKELEAAQKQLLERYNAKEESEIAAFPQFEFEDPKIDPIVEEPKECKYCDELDEPKGPVQAKKDSKEEKKPKDGGDKKKDTKKKKK